MNLQGLEWKNVDYVYLVSMETCARLLWWWQWTFGYHKMRGISYITKELLGSRAVFLNRWAAARHRALASIIPGRERFSWKLSF